ncbi:nicotinate phosphoribosyltransferase [Peribacillus asahii]|uniref:nicotinate phosphoribosyltransferase n=1 Tax=Peribacillus asahii TaxID=228899 RepID=UPI003817DC7C
MLKDLRSNPLMLTDAYNLSHQRLKVNTDWEVSHIYNRAEGMILYGFNEMVNSILNIQITKEMVQQLKDSAKVMNIVAPIELFERVVDEFNGYFPIMVQSLPEGTWCPKGTPFAQVRNTAVGFGELVTWLEGIFLQASFPCGTATEAFHIRKYLEDVKKDKKFDDSFLIRAHSFGFRGHRSLEDAYWASTSWNMFLFGTDDVHSLIHTPSAKVGSISALAHKVTQQYDVEYDGYVHAIDATAEAGEKIVALVIDTYDANRFIKKYLVPLARHAKEKGIHLVIRPDSGDVFEQVVDVYKVVKVCGLDNVSAIIGEGMNLQAMKRADLFFNLRSVPLTFVSYGIGGGFYNHINRDTLGFAMKTAFSNGAPRMKFGMEPLKRSIPDAVALYLNKDGQMVAEREEVIEEEYDSLYRIIYCHNSAISEPYKLEADWNDTQRRALENLGKDLQERIILSDSINELVAEFEKIYG